MELLSTNTLFTLEFVSCVTEVVAKVEVPVTVKKLVTVEDGTDKVLEVLLKVKVDEVAMVVFPWP